MTFKKVIIGDPHERNFDENSPGMDDIRLVKSIDYDTQRSKPRDQIVGSFGIVSDDGHATIMSWKVSGDRRDKRHGFVGWNE